MSLYSLSVLQASTSPAELSNLRLKGVIPHATYFELFIESSKTYQYHEVAVVRIVKTSTDLCPWANLVKYLSQAKLALLTSLNGGDDFLLGIYRLNPEPNLSVPDPRFLTTY